MVTNSLTDRLEVDLLRSMIVIVTVVFCLLSFFVGDNHYLSNEIALWAYFIALSPVVYLFTLSIKSYPKTTLATLFSVVALSGAVYSYYNHLQFVEANGYKPFLLIAHAYIVLCFFYKATKTLKKSNATFEYSNTNDKANKSSSRKLTRRRNRRAQSRAKNSVKLKSGQYRG